MPGLGLRAMLILAMGRALLILGLILSLGCEAEVPPTPAATPQSAPDPLDVLAERAIQALASADDAAAQYASACALCHGEVGQGNRAADAPSIAGAPTWYLLQQLRRFRDGIRGAHPQDRPGRAMAKVAKALAEDADPALVRRIRAMPPVATASTVVGDAEHGRLVYAEQCMECHRYNGAGEQFFKSSPLTLFPDWYLQRELEEFRSGLRGAKEADIPGSKMRAVARFLDDKSRRDVIAYISQLAKDHPPER